MSSVFLVAGAVALLVTGFCWLRLQRAVRLPQKLQSGLMKPHTFNNLPGDGRLVQSAQMFHYQHQRQQILSLHTLGEDPRAPESGASSDEDDDDGDFTVYECPGLAPSGEMEVRNPLFDDATLHFHRNSAPRWTGAPRKTSVPRGTGGPHGTSGTGAPWS